jgi:hypothetical protein
MVSVHIRLGEVSWLDQHQGSRQRTLNSLTRKVAGCYGNSTTSGVRQDGELKQLLCMGDAMGSALQRQLQVHVGLTAFLPMKFF